MGGRHILTSSDRIRVALVDELGGGEGGEPVPGEGVAEHGLQTEPLGPPRPRGLLLLQLLDALQRERERNGFI